jgi:hypothetical protein
LTVFSPAGSASGWLNRRVPFLPDRGLLRSVAANSVVSNRLLMVLPAGKGASRGDDSRNTGQKPADREVVLPVCRKGLWPLSWPACGESHKRD